jgi:hypothetical protein
MSNPVINNLRIQYRDLAAQVREGILARRGQVDFLSACRSRCLRYKASLEQVRFLAHLFTNKKR